MVKTLVLKVSPVQPEPEKIKIAAQTIRDGGLVAFPTETVYGLGANALDERAVLRIFQAKNRPTDNPLIVHIANKEDVYLLAETVPSKAEILIDRFWPGPLTLLMPKSELVPAATTAGLATVAIRMPSHPIARALIAEADVPIAAPSANLAGKPSPTTAQHVWDDLSGKIEVLIDGGEVGFGVESTVLDLTADPPTVLRPGPVTVGELRQILGRVEVHPIATAEIPAEAVIARAPGMKYRHYAPSAEVVVVEGPLPRVVGKIQELWQEYQREGKRVGVMATEETAGEYQSAIVKVVGTRRNLRTVAKNLFQTFRDFDREGVDVILAEGVEISGIGLAIMNRLRKAAVRVIKV
ncbi:MAG: tRNA threonylcarbamoyladenosine biosynthesis protein [Candidatus Hadarchaeum yellowstonense]|jgi:L-threonylcarbamoyladenylate synthase|uniref:Threonylcarbamoyl-AMP synthase n=1 Tax=Hadarchaeum yellowstonense TaxID=1776334 RepID=A0A147K0Z6_HADYE|nr:MAG: tRNA threonylcarbamoyladenosine biosynthesis protein [Candidatus Hadarchaeum yellowstonense]